jgi:chromate transporter
MKTSATLSLAKFFAVVVRVGATGFGGPMALISMLQQHLVERRKAVTNDEFSEGVAIGQVLPGPIAVDAAIHCGYRLHGWLGAVAGAIGLVLPPFLIMLVLTPLYFHCCGRVPDVQGFFAGVRPAVAAAIVAATVRLGKRGIRDRRGCVIAVTAFVWMLVRDYLAPLAEGLPKSAFRYQLFEWSGAIFLVIVSGLLGMLFYRHTIGADGGRPLSKPAKEGGGR